MVGIYGNSQEDRMRERELDRHLATQEEPPEPSECDKREARDNAVDYVLGTQSLIFDVICGEYGDNTRLTSIMAMMATENGSNLANWTQQYKDELAEKLVKFIDVRYEIELGNLHEN